MDISIITVTYQSKDTIDACILSIATHAFSISYEHIVVDNASTDGTIELLEEGYSGYVHLIKNKCNVGFARANNQALQIAKGRYILFFNPDMQMRDGLLDHLVAWADKQDRLGIASCKLLDYTASPHAALRPSKLPFLTPYLPAFLKIKPFFCSVNPRFFYKDFEDEKIQEVELVRGAFMLIKREILNEIGYGFDPRYFILFEDIDLCREMKRRGYKILYNPYISCIDYFGRSFAKHSRAWKYCQMARSFVAYVKKWHSPLHLLWAYPAIVLGFLLRIAEWGLQESFMAIGSMRKPL